MTGPAESVLGVKPELAINFKRTGMPTRFDTAPGKCKMDGCIFEIDNKTGVCVSAQAVSVE